MLPSAPFGLNGYHLVVRHKGKVGEIISTEAVGNLAAALQSARLYDGPTEIWHANDHLCTVDNVAGDGSIWTIEPGPTHIKLQPKSYFGKAPNWFTRRPVQLELGRRTMTKSTIEHALVN